VVAFLVLAFLAIASTAGTAVGEEIVDQRGHHVHLDAPAECGVFLPMPAPSMFIAIDGTDRHIAAMNPSSRAAMQGSLLGRLFPRMTKVPTDVVQGASFIPNVESILALHPDAVFQWANVGTDAIEALDRAGLAVFGMLSASQDDLTGSIEMMGQVTGKSEHAHALVTLQAERRRDIEAALKNLANADRPGVLYLGRFTEALSVAGPGTYNDFYIRLAGGRNVVPPGLARIVTFEQILAWNPDVILLGNFDPAMPSDVYKDPRWADVAAVKARRVYRMPLGGYRWDPPSQESALAWTWLLAILHPEKSIVDLRSDLQTWYRFLYSHDLTDAETDRILFVAENESSAGYGRFTRR
jgi:iron complex transport system substrate-binding protein